MTEESKENKEARAAEDALLEKANNIRALWKTLASAFNFPAPEPPRNKAQWDFVLQEGAWLAHDMMQERLWKQAAAYHTAHAAAAFSRASLKPTKTVVCWSVEKAPGELGKVRTDGKPLFPEAKWAPSGRGAAVENGQDASESGPIKADIRSLFYTCTPEFMPAVQQHLEEEDVARLTRHSDAQAAYQAAWETARRLQPVHLDEEDLPLGKRARRMRAKGPEEEGFEGMASPPGMRPPRPRPGVAPGMPGARGAMDVDGDGARGDKRKRKQARGDFGGDDDYDVPGKMGGAGRDRGMPMQQQRQGMGMQGGGMGPQGMGMQGVPGDRKGGQKGPGMKSPQKGQPPGRIDPMGKMGQVGPRGGMYGRGGQLPIGPWNQQDDNVLIAIVTEFGANWHLVADVLRAASTMAGVYRRWDACKQRYIALAKMYQQDEQEGGGSEQQKLEQLLNTPLMAKQQAKEVLSNALPVQQSVLLQHQEVVAGLAGRLRQRRQQERMQTRETHRIRAPEHNTHQRVAQTLAQMMHGRRTLTPLEFGVVVDPNAPPLHQLAPLPVDPTKSGAQAGGAPKQQVSGAGQPPAQAQAKPAQHPAPGAAPGGSAAAQQGDAAAAAAAQANAAAAAAAAAAVAQQQGQPTAAAAAAAAAAGGGAPPQAAVSAGGGAGGRPPESKPLSIGLTREQILQIVQTTPIHELQVQAQAAARALQENNTEENQAKHKRAQTLLTAAQTLAQRKAQHAAQQQAAAAAAAQQQGGVPGGMPGAPGMPGPGGPMQPGAPVGPGAGSAGKPPLPGGGPSGGQSMLAGPQLNQIVNQIRQCVTTGQLTHGMAQQLLANVRSGNLSPQQQAQLAQIGIKIPQMGAGPGPGAGAAGGRMPGMGPPGQMQGSQGPGPMGGWPGSQQMQQQQQMAAAAAAAAAQQAAQAAAQAAVAGQQGSLMPGMGQYMNQLPSRPPSTQPQ